MGKTLLIYIVILTSPFISFCNERQESFNGIKKDFGLIPILPGGIDSIVFIEAPFTSDSTAVPVTFVCTKEELIIKSNYSPVHIYDGNIIEGIFKYAERFFSPDSRIRKYSGIDDGNELIRITIYDNGQEQSLVFSKNQYYSGLFEDLHFTELYYFLNTLAEYSILEQP